MRVATKQRTQQRTYPRSGTFGTGRFGLRRTAALARIPKNVLQTRGGVRSADGAPALSARIGRTSLDAGGTILAPEPQIAAFSEPTITTGIRHFSHPQAVRRAREALPTLQDPFSGQRTYGNRGGVTPKQYRRLQEGLGYLPGVGASLQPEGWNIALAAHQGMQGPRVEKAPERPTFLSPREDPEKRRARLRRQDELLEQHRNETMLGGRATLA